MAAVFLKSPLGRSLLPLLYREMRYEVLLAGRLYLSKSKKLLSTLAGSLKAEIKPSITLEQIVAALQKLSLR